MVFRKGNRLAKMVAGQGRGIGDDCAHTVAKDAMKRPSEVGRIDAA